MAFNAATMLASLYAKPVAGPTPESPPVRLVAELSIHAENEHNSHDANEWNWQHIDATDRDYLLGPRNWPDPCPWCGGRLVHSTACDDLRREWQPTLPFGRYKGLRISNVPVDYLQWLTRNKPELPTDLREAIESRLKLLD